MTNAMTPMYERRTFPLVVLMLLGLPFLLLALYLGGREAAFVVRAERATATFAGAEAHSGGNHGGSFLFPTFTFSTGDGREHTLKSRNGSTEQPYADGQRVEVLYDPASPEEAVVNSFWGLWGATLFLSLFAFGFFILPGMAWVRSRRG